VRPQAAHAGEVVLQLRQLDLELALGAVGVVGEDVEDDGRAVDDRQAQLPLQVALLTGRELVVDGDDVGVGGLRGNLDLLDLARPDVGVRMRPIAVLDGLPDDRDACRAQQLAQLGEVLAVLERRHAEGTLLRPSLLLDDAGGARWRVATVTTTFHCSVPV
jgi:hypothetical protein